MSGFSVDNIRNDHVAASMLGRVHARRAGASGHTTSDAQGNEVTAPETRVIGATVSGEDGAIAYVTISGTGSEHINSSGGDLVYGDVVVRQADGSVTTTTTPQDTRPVGVVQLGAGDGDPVLVVWQGRVEQMNTTASVTAGNYCETSSTGGDATENATIRAGSFGTFLEDSVDPPAMLFGQTYLTGGGGGGGGVIGDTYGGGAVQRIADSGVAVELDLSAAHVFDITLTADCTITLVNLSPSGVEGSWYVILRQGGTGSYAVTFADAFVDWQDPTTGLGGGTPPTLFTAVGAENVIGLACLDGASVGAWNESGGSGSSLTIKDEGTPLATAATSIDFVGDGVVASGVGAAKTVTIPGGASLDSTTPANIAAVGSAGVAATAPHRDHVHALTYHSEPLTDGASNFIFSGGDIVVVTGVPN